MVDEPELNAQPEDDNSDGEESAEVVERILTCKEQSRHKAILYLQ